jgi:hypothetical protein
VCCWRVRVALTFERSPHGALTYVCKSHDYFDYHLSDGSLQPDRNLLDHPLISKPLSLEGFETVFVAATGWEMRGVFVTATGISITTRERIALLVGSVSGFYAGRWLFSTRLPRCDSDDVLMRLQKPEYWEKLKLQKCRQMCLRYRLWFSSRDNEPLVSNVDPLKRAAEALPQSIDRDNIIGYLNGFERTFRVASSSEGKIGETDFTRVAGGIPYLMEELFEHQEILRAAFPTRIPQLALMLNDDPEVIKREVADRTVTLNFVTKDAYERQLVGSVVIVVCVTIIFLLTAVFGAIFLVRERLISKQKNAGAI